MLFSSFMFWKAQNSLTGTVLIGEFFFFFGVGGVVVFYNFPAFKGIGTQSPQLYQRSISWLGCSVIQGILTAFGFSVCLWRNLDQ